MFVAGDGQRAVGQAVVGVFEGEDARAAGVAAGELERALDGLGAAVAEEEGVAPRAGVFGERLAQQAGEQRAVHLHHVGQVEVEHVLDGLFDDRDGCARCCKRRSR